MASSKQASTPRPGVSHSHSHYVQLLLQQDHIPRIHNILAALFVWLLLAGFLVFPGTFTSIKNNLPDDETPDRDDGNHKSPSPDKIAKTFLLNGVKHAPLLVVAAVICGITAIGMLSLALKHRKNYVWLANRLFVPGMANSLAGMLSTVIGVYMQQEGVWSMTAMITGIVIAAIFGVCAGLWVLIEFGPLRRIRKRHGRHYEGWVRTEGEGEEGVGKKPEGVRVETEAVV